MAKMGPIVITITGDESMGVMCAGCRMADLTVGIHFGDASLWTRSGYDTAMEDCDRLMAAVVEMKEVLRKESASQEVLEADAPQDADDLGSPEDQKVEF